MTQEVMNTRQAAEYLNLAERTLEAWRSRKQGPPYMRMGRSVRYRKGDLDSWMENNRQQEIAR